MEQTTSAQTACDVTIKIEDSTDVVTDISGSSNQLTWSMLAEMTTYRNAGTDEYPRRILIGKDANLSLVVVYTAEIYSADAPEALELLQNWHTESIAATNSRAVELYIPRETPVAGENVTKWTFNAVLNDLDIPMTAREGAMIMVSANLSIDGELTKTIVTT